MKSGLTGLVSGSFGYSKVGSLTLPGMSTPPACKQRYTTSHAVPPHILAMTYLHVMQGPQPAKHTNTQHGGGESGMHK